MAELCNLCTTADGALCVQEARLDVEMFLQPVTPDRLVDATVRHPTAKTYVNAGADVAGSADQRGVDDKARRYPPRGGNRLLCFD